MDANLTSKDNHRISGTAVSVGRLSNPSAQPGHNGGFSDGFPTKSPVVTCHSGQPGKSSNPKNPMKSQAAPPCKGFPPVPPAQSIEKQGVKGGFWRFSVISLCAAKRAEMRLFGSNFGYLLVTRLPGAIFGCVHQPGFSRPSGLPSILARSMVMAGFAKGPIGLLPPVVMAGTNGPAGLLLGHGDTWEGGPLGLSTLVVVGFADSPIGLSAPVVTAVFKGPLGLLKSSPRRLPP
jgi:hypothetical protein